MDNYLKKLGEFVKKNVVYVAAGVLILASSGSAFYFYTEYNDLKVNPSTSGQDEVTQQDEVAKLVGLVSKLMILPDGETPTLATVADPEKLKDQAFFAKAKVGDKVLIYTNAKKAILYNLETNKIVEVAPVNIGVTPTPTSTPKPSK